MHRCLAACLWGKDKKYLFYFFSSFWMALFFALLISGCTTSKENENSKVKFQQPSFENLGIYKEAPLNGLGEYNHIHLGQLKAEKFTGASRLGFGEVRFNTCTTQANQSQRPRCAELYFARLKVKLSCRNRDISGAYLASTPLSSTSLVWTVGQRRGTFRTKESGIGEIYWISIFSNHGKMARINLGAHILKKRLGNQWEVILPKHWCDGI